MSDSASMLPFSKLEALLEDAYGVFDVVRRSRNVRAARP